MALVFCPALSIEIDVGGVTVIVICASLHVKLGVSTAVLDSVEDVEAVVLVKFKRLSANFVRARVIAVIVVAFMLSTALLILG